MTWTTNDFPGQMNYLNPQVRDKAIDRAKDWYDYDRKTISVTYKGGKWCVGKGERDDPATSFDTKDEAVQKAKEITRQYEAQLVIENENCHIEQKLLHEQC